MILKPLYRSGSKVLVGLHKDFQELCVLDGLVVEIDIEQKNAISKPLSGLHTLKSSSYLPIRQHEKAGFSKIISRKLKRKQIRMIETELENPSKEIISALTWIPDRFSSRITD